METSETLPKEDQTETPVKTIADVLVDMAKRIEMLEASLPPGVLEVTRAKLNS